MRVRGLLDSRLTGLREQLTELTELRGKNKGVVEYMMGKVRAEKDEFESGLQRYYAVRSVFSHPDQQPVRPPRPRRPAPADRRNPRGDAGGGLLQDPVRCDGQLLRPLHAQTSSKSGDEISEILAMMEAVYKKFAVEHGLKLGSPTSFSLLRYEKELRSPAGLVR